MIGGTACCSGGTTGGIGCTGATGASGGASVIPPRGGITSGGACSGLVCLPDAPINPGPNPAAAPLAKELMYLFKFSGEKT